MKVYYDSYLSRIFSYLETLDVKDDCDMVSKYQLPGYTTEYLRQCLRDAAVTYGVNSSQQPNTRVRVYFFMDCETFPVMDEYVSKEEAEFLRQYFDLMLTLRSKLVGNFLELEIESESKCLQPFNFLCY